MNPPVWDLFRLLENCFLLFCRDLAVLIFSTLLVDFQRINRKSAHGSRGGDIQTPSVVLLYTSDKLAVLITRTISKRANNVEL